MKKIFISVAILLLLGGVAVGAYLLGNKNICQHSFSEWTPITPATCTAQGVEMRICELCSHGENRFTKKLPHTEAIDEGVAATCTAAGLTEGKHCAVCGEVLLAQAPIPPAHPDTDENGECDLCEEKYMSIGLAYTLSQDQTYYIVTGIGECTDREIVIPATYQGLPVKEIGEIAFAGIAQITGITLPDSLTSIGMEAFGQCPQLQFSHFGNGSYLGNAENPYLLLVQPQNENITSLEIHENTKLISPHAFSWCSSLGGDLTIPASVTFIGDSAFHMTKITSVTFAPQSQLESLGNVMFQNCLELLTATLPETLTVLPYGTFDGCRKLQTLSFGENSQLQTIKMKALSNCRTLESLALPATLTSVESRAFNRCDTLTHIYFGGTSTAWSNITIGTDNDPLTHATLHFAD